MKDEASDSLVPQDRTDELARRKLLKLGVYAAPAILGRLVISDLAMAQPPVSCQPQGCPPATCQPPGCVPVR